MLFLSSEERKIVLEKSDQLRYFQTDRVKHLHRGLVLSEVLKEREQQVHLKQEIENERQKRDDKFVLLQRKEREMKEEEEKLKKEQRIQDVSISGYDMFCIVTSGICTMTQFALFYLFKSNLFKLDFFYR